MTEVLETKQTRARAFDPSKLHRLQSWLSDEFGTPVAITAARLLSGGAVQENWQFDATVGGAARSWVLRTDAPGRLAFSLDREAEFAVINCAHKAGVPVAEPIRRCSEADIIGRPFLIQTFLSGQAHARRITRDPKLPQYGPRLAAELGAALARIHAIRIPNPELSVLPIPLLPPARAETAKLKTALEGASQARPALDYALSWLDSNAPHTRQLCLVHGDFRTGNYMIEDGHLSAILDWEFAHWGDPLEDIGWFCARCWRFGSDGIEYEAGGIAPRRALYDSYNARAAGKLDEAAIAYWEIMAAAKWAVISVLQGDRFLTGGESAIELALTGLMTPEMEFDCLEGISGFSETRGR